MDSTQTGTHERAARRIVHDPRQQTLSHSWIEALTSILVVERSLLVHKRTFLTLSAALLSSFVCLLGQGTQEPDRVGSETCRACHEIAPAFFRTPHAETECETCHGPGEAHVAAGGDMSLSFVEESAEWGISQCLSCHRQDSETSAFRRSAHGLAQVACSSCHQVHAESVVFDLLKMQETRLCASCHQATVAQFRKPFRHPVLEGAMECSACHSPHSEERAPMRLLSAATSENCVSCHSDKKGPFVFEHAPLKVNDCQSCHQPHGSINPKMLRRVQVHQLCLECHSRTVMGVAGTQPPAFHDIRSGRFQSCTVCHREIHGSNASPLFLR